MKQHMAVIWPRKGEKRERVQHPRILGKRIRDQECITCRINIQGDCRKRTIGEDGYLHFPEGDCHEPMEAA